MMSYDINWLLYPFLICISFDCFLLQYFSKHSFIKHLFYVLYKCVRKASTQSTVLSHSVLLYPVPWPTSKSITISFHTHSDPFYAMQYAEYCEWTVWYNITLIFHLSPFPLYRTISIKMDKNSDWTVNSGALERLQNRMIQGATEQFGTVHPKNWVHMYHIDWLL